MTTNTFGIDLSELRAFKCQKVYWESLAEELDLEVAKHEASGNKNAEAMARHARAKYKRRAQGLQRKIKKLEA